MRQLKAISPTSLHLWESNREDFYMKYLSDFKRPYDPQSAPASVGSAFDAYVKAALHHDIFGNDGDGVFKLENLLIEQVDESCFEFGKRAGKECFDRYCQCGIYADLLKELLKSEEPPRFEFKLIGDVNGIPMVGKPDLWYKLSVDIVYDWKVMGYCSPKSAVSPKKFYRSCQDTWTPDAAIKLKATRGGGDKKAHKGYEEIDHHGHKIGGHWMEDVDKKWADQIAIYSWLLGMKVGDEETITGIDQICCKPHPANKKLVEGGIPSTIPLPPLIRIAQHRCRISGFWQHSLMNRIQDMWKTIKSGYIFDDLSREDSDARCEVMDMKPAKTILDANFWAMCNERTYRG